VEDTWTSRDLPVLDVIVGLLDQGQFLVTVSDISAKTGFEPAVVDRAITALEGPYVVKYEQFMTGGIPDSWRVRQVTQAARQVVGQWPTPETLIDRLAEAFDGAADKEPDPERKGKLRQVASFLGSAGRDVATEVVSKVILHTTGMG
jgi:hypothetical protein